MAVRINVDRQRLAEICRRHRISRLALFGSILRDDFRPDSDVDVLLEFKEGTSVGFFKLFEIEDQLSQLFAGHRVESTNPKCLSRWMKNQVLREAEVQYAEE